MQFLINKKIKYVSFGLILFRDFCFRFYIKFLFFGKIRRFLQTKEFNAGELDIKYFRQAKIFKNTMYEVSALYPRIPGYVLEFGVASVYTINMLAGFFREKTIYGFDSFDGLPEDWVKNPGRIDFPKGFFKGSLPEVRHNVVLISGLFQNVLPTWLKKNPDAVSYLHIDSDLYSSARYVLNVLNDRIKPGTVVVFNELCRWDEKTSDGFKGEYANWQEGEWKALKEWMIENNRTIKILCRDNAESAVIVVCK